MLQPYPMLGWTFATALSLLGWTCADSPAPYWDGLGPYPLLGKDPPAAKDEMMMMAAAAAPNILAAAAAANTPAMVAAAAASPNTHMKAVAAANIPVAAAAANTHSQMEAAAAVANRCVVVVVVVDEQQLSPAEAAEPVARDGSQPPPVVRWQAPPAPLRPPYPSPLPHLCDYAILISTHS